MQTPAGAVYQFGQFEVNAASGELFRNGKRVKLQEQPFRLLVVLLENSGQVVGREELRSRIWAEDTFVDFDGSLRVAIRKLRDALGDDPERPRYIETIPKRGYRFIAPMEWPAEVPPPPVQEAQRGSQAAEPKRRIRLLRSRATGLIVILFALAIVVLSLRSWRDRLVDRSSVPPIHSLAVLPFVNLTGDAEQDYFADGMTEALTTELGRTHVVRVISRTSAMQYKRTNKSIPEIARELNVDAVVEGGVQRASDRVSITAQLIYAPTDRHIWAQAYERDIRDSLAMQREVAQTIASAVQANFTPQNQVGPAHLRQVDPEAYREYLRGRLLWGQRSEDALDRSISHFDRALQIDPNFALAYAAEAEAYIPLAVQGYRAPTDLFARAKEMSTKALALDDTLPEAHNALAAVRFNQYDWAGAEKEFKRAIELDPSYVTAHLWYGFFLEALGQQSANLAERKLGQELDPLNLAAGAAVGSAYFYLGQYDQAIEEQHKTLELDPNFSQALVGLGEAYEAKGMYPDAIAAYGKAGALASLGHTYAVSGRKAEALQILHKLDQQSKHRYVSPFDRALVYVGLGQNDQALACLESAKEQDVPLHHINVDKRFDPLRSDKRYQDLLRRIGFPE